MGGSSGSAISTTLIARREQFHQQRMIDHLSSLDAPYQSSLHSVTQMFINKGSDPRKPLPRHTG
jgi:DHA2 family multidrug resistance protein